MYICDIGLDQNKQPVSEAGLRHGEFYSLVGLAFDVQTRQERVIYKGISGADKDQYFSVSQELWAAKFVRQLTHEEERSVPAIDGTTTSDKTVGFISQTQSG